MRADAGDGLQDVVLGFEGVGGFDQFVHAGLEVEDLAMEKVDDLVDVFADLGRAVSGGVATILFGREHGDELLAPVVKIAYFLEIFGRERPHGGGDDLGEVGDDGGVDGVGFDKRAHGFGEVANLSGVDDDGGKAFGEQGAEGLFLIRACGLADDPFGRQRSNPGEELGDAFGGVVEAAPLVVGPNVDIEEILGDIDAEEAFHDEIPRKS